MEVSKIHLSSSETELMQNAEIILTKNRILGKMRTLLGQVQDKQLDFIQKNNLTGEIFSTPSKISKGENYLGLPYLILDCPRYSSANNFFFIRTMFWWGNFFSCTLHISGDSKQVFKDKIRQSYTRLENHYISINEDPWVHHLGASDYRLISSMTEEEFTRSCENFDHIKIASRHSLTEWQKAPLALYEKWKFLLYICGLVT